MEQRRGQRNHSPSQEMIGWGEYHMEIWDLYTSDRERTGQTIRRGEKIPEGLFRLVVHICIFNSQGQMLIQQRQVTKSGWPDLWDLSVGGHVVSGETTAMAGEREAKEELGISIPLQGKRPAVSPTFDNGFDDMYTLEMDLDLNRLRLQKEEVQGVRWATQEEIAGMIEEGSFVPYHEALIALLFYLRNHPEAHISK